MWKVLNTGPTFWAGRNRSTFRFSKSLCRRSGVAVHILNLWHQHIDGIFGVFFEDKSDSAFSWVRKKRFFVLFRSIKSTHRCLSLLYKKKQRARNRAMIPFFSCSNFGITQGDFSRRQVSNTPGFLWNWRKRCIRETFFTQKWQNWGTRSFQTRLIFCFRKVFLKQFTKNRKFIIFNSNWKRRLNSNAEVFRIYGFKRIFSTRTASS